MTSEQNLHLKIDFSEALTTKKQILSSEINLLGIVQRLNNYLELRKKELAKKEELRKTIKSLVMDTTLLLRELPKVAEEEERFEKEVHDMNKTSNPKDKKNKKILEFELREIKRKLQELDEMG